MRIFQNEDENATVGSIERHGNGDNDYEGYEIFLLLLKNKGIYAEGLLLNLDRPRSSVPFSAEIVVGQARVGGRGYYGGHLVWNMWGLSWISRA